ncbi:MAG TPA: DUF1294 domain-containing protein [Aurantimonas sp.]|jgi:uncharacterized membrane protein YsdA (DUF1294 family)|nr:DUF1294 domain-containing protein [Aurantimonas sp.]
MVPVVLAYLLFVNTAAYAAFAYDKAMAIGGRRRLPEQRLLGLALLGGSVGAVAAQRVLRHKTQKEPFRSQLQAIVLLHVLLLIGVAIAGPQLLALVDGVVAGDALPG